MQHEDIYRDWVRARKQAKIDPDFVGRVMDGINQLESSRSRLSFRWARHVDRISASSWAKAAVIAVAAGLGFGRILLTLHLLLLP